MLKAQDEIDKLQFSTKHWKKSQGVFKSEKKARPISKTVMNHPDDEASFDQLNVEEEKQNFSQFLARIAEAQKLKEK